MEARVTANSQAHRLRERMAQAEVQHGQEIRADVPGIRVMAMAREWFSARHRGKGEIFFCGMGPIRVREVTVPPQRAGRIQRQHAADRGRRDAGSTRDQERRAESGSELTLACRQGPPTPGPRHGRAMPYHAIRSRAACPPVADVVSP